MHHPKGDERREFQRLRLDTPLAGTFGPVPVTLLEAGVLGSRIQHEDPIEERAELHFMYEARDIRMRCEVVRTFEADPVRHPGGKFISGLRFRAALGDSGDHLRVMLAELVVRALDERGDSSATRIRLRAVDGD